MYSSHSAVVRFRPARAQASERSSSVSSVSTRTCDPPGAPGMPSPPRISREPSGSSAAWNAANAPDAGRPGVDQTLPSRDAARASSLWAGSPSELWVLDWRHDAGLVQSGRWLPGAMGSRTMTKRIVVTGGTGDLGRAANHRAAEDASVILNHNVTPADDRVAFQNCIAQHAGAV